MMRVLLQFTYFCLSLCNVSTCTHLKMVFSGKQKGVLMAPLNKFRDVPTSELLLVLKQLFHWVLHKTVKLHP